MQDNKINNKNENPVEDKPYKWKHIIKVPENSNKIRLKIPKIGKNISEKPKIRTNK